MSGSFTSALFALSIPGLNVPSVPPAHVELGEEWKSFEKTLGQYKDEYSRIRREYRAAELEFDRFTKDIRHIQFALTTIEASDLRATLETMIDMRLRSTEYKEMKENISVLAGKLKAMNRVLTETHAHRYNEYMCPVCMDKNVDVFLDPCGHLLCSGCLIRLRDEKCPTCRQTVVAKRMYPTS